MYEVSLCCYRENEKTCEKDEWYIADTFGEYESLDVAHKAASMLTAHYRGFVELYCVTHECDGISFDIVDTETENAIAAYEVSAAGNVTIWHESECHEWRLV